MLCKYCVFKNKFLYKANKAYSDSGFRIIHTHNHLHTHTLIFTHITFKKKAKKCVNLVHHKPCCVTNFTMDYQTINEPINLSANTNDLHCATELIKVKNELHTFMYCIFKTQSM